MAPGTAVQGEPGVSGVGLCPDRGNAAWLQLHSSSPVTSTDYDTAADATETSSYFSAQGYQSRWGPHRGDSAQQAGSPQPWHGGGRSGLDRQNPSPGGFTKATRSLSSMLTKDLRSHPD